MAADQELSIAHHFAEVLVHGRMRVVRSGHLFEQPDLALVVFRHRLPDLEADPLELAGHLLDVVVVQLVLEGERLELGRLEVATLLGTLHEMTRLVAFKQFVKLVLGQIVLSSLTL